MLFQRVLTSFALLFVILGAVFGLPANVFYLFVGLVISIAVWEWAALAGLSSLPSKLVFMLLMWAVMFATLHIGPVSWYLAAGVVFWIAVLLLICVYPRLQQLWGSSPVLLLFSLPLFIPGWLAFVFLRDQPYHAFHLLTVLGLVAAADIGAFFAGRAFGRHKLAVRVSPNKTWEGFYGGLLACVALISLLAFSLVAQVADMQLQLWSKLAVCALCIAAFSVVGDLFESMVKRFRDVKDSGSILPGHGGMLDRIDGLTAATPVYALLLVMLAPGFA